MSLVDTFQDLVAQVPDLVQPLIVAAAGAVPFIEGEGAAVIGIIGGIHPAIAAALRPASTSAPVQTTTIMNSRNTTAETVYHQVAVIPRDRRSRPRRCAAVSVSAAGTGEVLMRPTIGP